MVLVGATDAQRHRATYWCSGAMVHHVARVQSLTIQTWMLCPSKPSVESCSGAGVHENAGTHLWTRQTHLLCHRELWTHPLCPLVEISKISKRIHEVSGTPSKRINFHTIPTMTYFIQFGVELMRTDAKYRWYMNVLRFAPYCNHNQIEISKVSKSVHEVPEKPSKMISFLHDPQFNSSYNLVLN